MLRCLLQVTRWASEDAGMGTQARLAPHSVSAICLPAPAPSPTGQGHWMAFPGSAFPLPFLKAAVWRWSGSQWVT